MPLKPDTRPVGYFVEYWADPLGEALDLLHVRPRPRIREHGGEVRLSGPARIIRDVNSIEAAMDRGGEKSRHVPRDLFREVPDELRDRLLMTGAGGKGI